MVITINNTPVEVQEGESVLDAARRAGFTIPSLCYAKGNKHKSSCMVCAVKNAATGQIFPSCTTQPTDGMQIDTESEDVLLVRTLSLELLLSDHRADCEAPCSMVCPKGLDIERMLWFYDAANYESAYVLIDKAFTLPEIGCDSCKAPCEKACRRGTVDKAVQIREIIRKVVQMYDSTPEIIHEGPMKPDKKSYNSRLGRFSPQEKQRLIETVDAPSTCLHCACAGRSSCKLRQYASAEGIKRTRYDASTLLPVMNKVRIKENMWFEQAKCIRCGICVYNSENGFTFQGRGFGMQVVLPEENRDNIKEELAGLCPTGAIYLV